MKSAFARLCLLVGMGTWAAGCALLGYDFDGEAREQGGADASVEAGGAAGSGGSSGQAGTGSDSGPEADGGAGQSPGGQGGSAGSSTPLHSCDGLANVCGLNNASCCARAVVPFASYHFGHHDSQECPAGWDCNLSDEMPVCAGPVGPLDMDVFEVTVGRFRNFVTALKAGWKPAPGAGAYPGMQSDPDAGVHNGWAPEWNTYLVPDYEATVPKEQHPYSTWHAGDDRRPINEVTWYMAFAFCVWDVGRLPTEAEWEHAASNLQNNIFPWGDSPAPPLDPDAGTIPHVELPCNTTQGCSVDVFRPVGQLPDGRTSFGVCDLADNVHEWVLDWYDPDWHSKTACGSGPNLTQGSSTWRVAKGGAAIGLAATWMRAAARSFAEPLYALPGRGFRCVYKHMS